MKLFILLTVFTLSACSNLPQHDIKKTKNQKNIEPISSLMVTPAATCGFGW